MSEEIMKHLNIQNIIIITVIGTALLYGSCGPIREFYTFPEYKGKRSFTEVKPRIDSLKENIFIIADNEGTEVFDLLAPFYLFNATNKANVFIIAEKKDPIIIRKGLFLIPHFTFKEIDSMKTRPAVVIIPALSAMDRKHQNPIILNWIIKQYSGDTKILSICEGALTAAATNLFDHKPITTHAISYDDIKRQFKNPNWMNNSAVTKCGNLYSTAGVSNAVEGSLMIITELFGEATVKKVMADIHYPHDHLKLEHHSMPLKTRNKLTIAKKILFGKNKNIGVLLQNGINEFELASLLDCYHRTFPSSIKSYVKEGTSITTKYGLTLLPTGSFTKNIPDELHILMPLELAIDEVPTYGTRIVWYERDSTYMITKCLNRISKQYGVKFEGITKQLLDYN